VLQMIRAILVFILILLVTISTSSYAHRDKPSIEKGQLIPVPQVSRSSMSSTSSQISSTGTIIFEESFEAGGTLWSAQEAWQIGSPNSGPNSGYGSSNCAATNLSGDYPNYADDWLISPNINLPPIAYPSSQLVLSSWEWFEIESGYDFGRVKISADDGNTWTELSQRSGSSDWRESTINLTAYAGGSVKIGFQFTSDYSITYLGWYLDSISITLYDPEPLEVALVSLNPQNFPFVYMNVAVNAFGQGISDLTQSNFRVYENEALQTDYFEVTPPDTSGGVRLTDIIFLMDNSGSMEDEVNTVKDHMIDFLDDLTIAGIDFALGLCRFGSDENSGYPIVEDGGNLTQDAFYFANNVWARNGIDGDFEPGWDALYESAVSFNFRPGAQRVFLLITDETPNDNSNFGNHTQNEAIFILQSNSITTFALIDLNDMHAIPDYGIIAEQTNGQYFDIYTPFDEIFNHISSGVANTYLIRYKSSDPVFNGILRNVEVVVSYQENQASATGSYVPGSAPQIRRTERTLDLHNQAWAEGTPFTIEVEILDSAEPYVQSAKLYYKDTPESIYHSAEMINSSGNLWEGLVSANAVHTPGLDYYIVATDGQSTVSDPSVDPGSNPYQLAILPNVAPQIVHIPITSAKVGNPIQISAEVVDNTNQLLFVKLLYRKTGQLLYQEVEMILTSGDTYQTEVSAGYVTPDGVEYYISAQDDLGVGSYNGTPDQPHAVSVWSEPKIVHVPDDYATIQDGIDAATEGDTVVVANGIYKGLGNVNLDFKGKAIEVKSQNGPGECIIDCENKDDTRGFHFHNGEISDSVLAGFTIKNGRASPNWPGYFGGGIWCDNNSSPRIMNNVIVDNWSGWGGGGIACMHDSSPIIVNNTIRGNTAKKDGGNLKDLWGTP